MRVVEERAVQLGLFSAGPGYETRIWRKSRPNGAKPNDALESFCKERREGRKTRRMTRRVWAKVECSGWQGGGGCLKGACTEI